MASFHCALLMAFKNVGIPPDGGAIYFLTQHLGLARAKEIVYSARKLPAAEAKDMGLISKVVPDDQLEAAQQLAKNSFYIDEFLSRELAGGRISSEHCHAVDRKILFHGHCQQKAVGSLADSIKILSFPENHTVETIPSGCCGMAGSFGYEKEHYDVSMKIGELVLFPSVRKHSGTCTVAAPGTSCRHQIKDGTSVKALHPVEILFEALV
jgi:Fe-S oxidoreductase